MIKVERRRRLARITRTSRRRQQATRWRSWIARTALFRTFPHRQRILWTIICLLSAKVIHQNTFCAQIFTTVRLHFNNFCRGRYLFIFQKGAFQLSYESFYFPHVHGIIRHLNYKQRNMEKYVKLCKNIFNWMLAGFCSRKSRRKDTMPGYGKGLKFALKKFTSGHSLKFTLFDEFHKMDWTCLQRRRTDGRLR